MKYSILMPYFDRVNELYDTFLSFKFHYKERDDFEVVLILDSKNNKKQLNEVVDAIKQFDFPIKFIRWGAKIHSPATLFNIASLKAEGEFFVITNPECIHQENILKGFDKLFKLDKDIYIVCGCYNGTKRDDRETWKKSIPFNLVNWYQHSEFNNRGYHWCSAISAKNYNLIGGFDDKFSEGIGYDDIDFRNIVLNAGIKFYLVDDLIVIHQKHNIVYKVKDELRIQNATLYNKKWANTKFYSIQLDNIQEDIYFEI